MAITHDKDFSCHRSFVARLNIRVSKTPRCKKKEKKKEREQLYGAFNGRSIVRRLKLPVVGKLLYAVGFIAEGAGPRRYRDLFVVRRKRRVECEFTSERAEILGKKKCRAPNRRRSQAVGIRPSLRTIILWFRNGLWALVFFSKKSPPPPVASREINTALSDQSFSRRMYEILRTRAVRRFKTCSRRKKGLLCGKRQPVCEKGMPSC